MTERESKRKASVTAASASASAGAGSGSPESDLGGRAVKRLKVPAPGADEETAERTAELGVKFIESLKAAKDKTGRPIATSFLTLPDKNEYPDYYQAILLPISIESIEEKIRRKEYPNLSSLESDVKRMVTNAKTYNEKTSDIYADAERIRKQASNWMVKHNPAYKNPEYQAIATPIPENLNEASSTVTTRATAESSERTRRETTVPKTPSSLKLTMKKSVRTSVPPPESSGPKDFTGKSFQEAQEQLIQECIDYTDEDSGLKIFTPFHNLPSRALTDYYHTIKYPMSLRAVQKKIQGARGRGPATGVSDFNSWDALEEEISYIWRNARTYNEDGSEIYELANDLEKFFKKRLELAKQQVDEPQQTLKLRMTQPKAPSIKLRFGAKDSPAPASTPNTPAARSSATPGVIVDSQALERQQAHVQRGINGDRQVSATPGPGGRNASGGGRASATPMPSVREGSVIAASPSVAPNGVKDEVQLSQSPALNSIRLASQAPAGSSQTPQAATTMLPPNPNPTASASPYPQQQPAPPTPVVQQPAGLPPFITSIYRPPGQTAADSIFPTLTLNTHPALHAPTPWQVTVPADGRKILQTVTYHVSGTHYILQVTPAIPVARTTRPYRLFVTVNHARVSENPRPMGPGGMERERVKWAPSFDAKLVAGVNRIEVEVLTTAPAPVEKGKEGKEGKEKEEVLLWEKMTVFVHLMKF